MSITDIGEAQAACEKIVDGIANVFVGDRLLLQKLLAAGLANGHVLFEDYPGLGKTLLAKVFAHIIGCNYTRIQFTPDLLPADIIGTKVWIAKDSTFELMKGPIFTNVLLADEINRTPPKTQAALLEAMEERQVTIEGETHRLNAPFFVVATQNPIEQEGTYPLPEAQMDRFLLKMATGYVREFDSEVSILERRIEWRKDDPSQDVRPALSSEDFSTLQTMAETGVYIDRCILEYVTELVRETRKHPKIEIGSSPRGALSLVKVSRAMALIRGRDFVTPDDVKMFAIDALAHRLIPSIEEVLEGVKPEDIVTEIVRQVPAPMDFYPK